MLAALIGSLASGETMLTLRRARTAALVYGFAALCVLCALGFFVGAGFIWASEIYGSFNTALGFGGGFLVLAGLALLIFKLTGKRRARRRSERRRSELAAIAAASGIALLPSLLKGKAGFALLAAPVLTLIAHAILKENQGKSRSSDDD